MKHVMLFFFSLVAFTFAGAVLWENVHALTTPLLGFIGILVLVGFGLSAAGDLKGALGTIVPLIPALRGKDGGS